MPKVTSKKRLHEGDGHGALLLPIPGGLNPVGIARPANRYSRISRLPEGRMGVVAEIAKFLANYIVLPSTSILVVSAWTLAAWLTDSWDRFPHLAITSPDRRCGKTRLLDLMRWITPRAHYTTNISPAAVYRLVEKIKPTLLLDEAQSIRRRASEISEVLRELLNAGIDHNAVVLRVGGESNTEIQEFKIYSPKVIALIGELDGVLADRCLPIDIKRKTAADIIQPYRSRIVEPIGKALHKRLEDWTKRNTKRVAKIYDHLDVFPIENDRMAELLLPLQAVLTVADPGSLVLLESYAHSLDQRDSDTISPGVQLLAACREILSRNKTLKTTGFIATHMLLLALLQRDWEPWQHWSQGQEMTAHALGNLLRPFGIRASRNRDQSARGFVVHDFEEAWVRYLPPTPSSKPAKAVNAT